MTTLLEATRGELLKLVYDLMDENQALKAQLASLKERLGNGSSQSGSAPTGGAAPLPTPPATSPTPFLVFKPSVKKPKLKKKRKKRSTNYARRKETPTQIINHAYDICPDCGGQLGKPTVSYTRQVIDIPLPKYEVVEHVVYRRWCYHCQQRYTPKIDLNDSVVGQHRFGVNLMSLVTTLREQNRLPLNQIQSYLETVYSLHLSEGELVKVLSLAAGKGAQKYQEIKKQILISPAINADETGWREDGVNGYLWDFSTPQYQFQLYRKSRGSQVVAEVLGEDGRNYEGVVVSDFYNAYNEHSGFHQRCWVHLLRDIDKLLEGIASNTIIHPTEHRPLTKEEKRQIRNWARKVNHLYQEARHYQRSGGPDPNLPLGVMAQQRIDKEQYFKDKLARINDQYVTSDLPLTTLASRIYNYLPELFTFVRFPDVPADNNPAERSLRHSVVQRKIFGGTRSEAGSRTKTILTSLFGTWRLQELNPLEQCRLLLISSP